MVTASERGLIIRIFNTLNGEIVNEVRKGADTAVISDISIDPLN